MFKYRKKEILAIVIILSFALFTTNRIYYKFINQRNVDYNSDQLDITFHEKSGDKINITTATAVSDNVGLSSKSYRLTVTNNSENNSTYAIKIIDNDGLISVDNCSNIQIPHTALKVAVHKAKEDNRIYYLSDLINQKVVEGKLKPAESASYTLRIWVANDSNNIPKYFHYHGVIQVEDNNNEIASIVNTSG